VLFHGNSFWKRGQTMEFRALKTSAISEEQGSFDQRDHLNRIMTDHPRLAGRTVVL